jgi:hypothetical protein
LTTEGDPKGRERAMLIVEGEKLATAIEYVLASFTIPALVRMQMRMS